MMIHCKHISKHYGRHSALDQVDFTLARGQMAFLTGPSGAGKTTLLKMLMMIERPTTGQIIVNGRNLSQLKPRHIPVHRRQVSMIFQDPHLLLKRTAFENIALPLHLAGHRSGEIKRRVQAALDKVGLLNKAKHLPCELSSGEQQRVNIARAVVTRPLLLLADEPTGNLDPKLSEEIMMLFQAFNQVGMTILIATHDLALIAKMPHPILTLRNGHIAAQGVMP